VARHYDEKGIIMRFHVSSLAGTALVGVVISSQALAGVNFGVFTGSRTTNLIFRPGSDQEKVSASMGEFGLESGWSPIPMVPVSIGGVASYYATVGEASMDDAFEDYINAVNSTGTFSASAGMTINGVTGGPNLTVWAPLPLVQPYLSLSYVFGLETQSTSATAETTSGGDDYTLEFSLEETYFVTDTDVALGLRLSPIPFVNVFGEYVMSTGSRTGETAIGTMSLSKNGDLVAGSAVDEFDTAPESDFSATTIRLGVGLAF
jgi:hypothetical protein